MGIVAAQFHRLLSVGGLALRRRGFNGARRAASGPECVKTLTAAFFWIIDVRWLSDRAVNAAAHIGRDLEHVNAVFTASGMGQN